MARRAIKACSLDPRQPVLSAAMRGERTIPKVAELFGVGAPFLNKMFRRQRAGGDLAPRTHGGGRVPRPGGATTSDRHQCRRGSQRPPA